MTDPQADAYDNFDEDPEDVFRAFDEGEKGTTASPPSWGIYVGGSSNVTLTNVTLTREWRGPHDR